MIGGHDEPWGAEAALDGAVVHERLLYVGQLTVGAETLHGDDLPPHRGGRQHQAGAHRRSVGEHRARSAFALVTGVLGARQAEALPQHVEQALAQPGVGHLAVGAVDVQRVVQRGLPGPGSLAHESARASARRAITPTAWRR